MYKTYVDKANRIKTYTHSNFFVIFWTMLMTALNLSLFDRWTPRKTSWPRIFGKSLKWKIGESPCISKDANSFCWHRITISNFLFVSALRYYIKNNISAVWVDWDVFWGTIKIVCKVQIECTCGRSNDAGIFSLFWVRKLLLCTWGIYD